MDLFRTKNQAHLVPIHPENIKCKDWVVLLEVSTIVGPSPDRLRVATTTQDKRIVWRFKSWRSQPFLVVEGYDPRIHVPERSLIPDEDASNKSAVKLGGQHGVGRKDNQGSDATSQGNPNNGEQKLPFHGDLTRMLAGYISPDLTLISVMANTNCLSGGAL